MTSIYKEKKIDCEQLVALFHRHHYNEDMLLQFVLDCMSDISSYKVYGDEYANVPPCPTIAKILYGDEVLPDDYYKASSDSDRFLALESNRRVAWIDIMVGIVQTLSMDGDCERKTFLFQYIALIACVYGQIEGTDLHAIFFLGMIRRYTKNVLESKLKLLQLMDERMTPSGRCVEYSRYLCDCLYPGTQTRPYNNKSDTSLYKIITEELARDLQEDCDIKIEGACGDCFAYADMDTYVED